MKMDKMLRISLVILLGLFYVGALDLVSEDDWGLFKDTSNDREHAYCPTDDLWDWKLRSGRVNATRFRGAATGCVQLSPCDSASIRDQYKDAQVTVSLNVNILCSNAADLSTCVTTQAKSDGQIGQLQKDFASAGISFKVKETRFRTSKYTTIAAYSQMSSKWYNELLKVKSENANDPKNNINVFVTNQKNGNQGTLLGIGTFPWDQDFLTAYGGLWVNAEYYGADEKTLSHEFGHNLGLWHTFHGVSEVSSCADPCYEEPHDKTDPFFNTVGDRCQDTAATPRNYQCSDPTGTACNGESWGKTDLDNIMGYTPDTCMNRITEQQAARAKCYLCRETPTVLDDSSSCPSL
eukprot:TRINITY_DN6534_c0_g1_i1.p1 TRINITY_DN6534_c0_g1~~TRINITY_DN6534_c0_g1_i1.p1  ORF type:complete len:350 (+),score=85.13 TRINITY_DN6534_c0_g1_i1:334-1383(+)